MRVEPGARPPWGSRPAAAEFKALDGNALRRPPSRYDRGMQLPAGERLGPYEITATLGSEDEGDTSTLEAPT